MDWFKDLKLANSIFVLTFTLRRSPSQLIFYFLIRDHLLIRTISFLFSPDNLFIRKL